ncbi:MAG: hypothetical protein Q9O62_13235 [Ardenticatenia bacterium]|nr:hypothetical protein [Ardenticatenia bacterium]
MEVEARQGLDRPRDLIAILGYERAQLAQNALHFPFLGQPELTPSVVELQGLQRFHKNSGSRGGLVVDNAPDPPPMFHLHRYHVPSGPLGDNGLLKPRLVVGVGNDALKFVEEAIVDGHQLLPKSVELGAGRVLHGTGLINSGLDGLHEGTAGLDAVGNVEEGRKLVSPVENDTAKMACGLERLADVQQLVGLKDAGFLGLHDEGAHVPSTPNGGTRPGGQETPGLGSEV